LDRSIFPRSTARSTLRVMRSRPAATASSVT
jgi:hypothetical protein